MENNFDHYTELAETLKVLAHPVRLCIIRGLQDKSSCNVGYMQECLDLPQSTVSQHLQKLKSAGIIESRRQGTEVYYSLKNNKVKEWIPYFFNS